jgi:hypothetical protein
MTHSREEVLADRRDGLPPDRFGRREQLLVGLFCLLAAVRVAVFTAAFPFFNNMDEQCHFDLVCKYAHGEVPRGLVPFDAEAAALMALYHSPEYSWRQQDYPSQKMPPPVWSLSAAERTKIVPELADGFRRKPNYEATQPPLYYAVIGLWYNLGKGLGIEGGNLLYWTRLSNLPLYGLLVWLSYLFAKQIFPASRFVYLGVPFVLAFLPQEIFLGLNNDVLLAPVATLSLYLLFRMYRAETPSLALALGAGVATVAAVLTKSTSLPLLVVVGIVAWLKLGLPWWRKQPLVHLLPVVVLTTVSGVLIGCWLARNHLVLGDLTGLAAKNRFLGWTPKPIAQYWNHPVFTPGGFLFFWNMLTTSIWHGEVSWHYYDLAGGIINLFYVLSTTVFLAVFAFVAIAGQGKAPVEARSAARICLLLFLLFAALPFLFSVTIDFGTIHRSLTRECPYFASGRLTFGALVPFLIMYLGGLEVLLGWLQLSFLRLPLLIVMIDGILLSQIAYSLDVFASQYNWYHLP